MGVDEQLPVINPALWRDLEKRNAAEILAGDADGKLLDYFFPVFECVLLDGVIHFLPAFDTAGSRHWGSLCRIGERLEYPLPSLRGSTGNVSAKVRLRLSFRRRCLLLRVLREDGRWCRNGNSSHNSPEGSKSCPPLIVSGAVTDHLHVRVHMVCLSIHCSL